MKNIDLQNMLVRKILEIDDPDALSKIATVFVGLKNDGSITLTDEELKILQSGIRRREHARPGDIRWSEE